MLGSTGLEAMTVFELLDVEMSAESLGAAVEALASSLKTGS